MTGVQTCALPISALLPSLFLTHAFANGDDPGETCGVVGAGPGGAAATLGATYRRAAVALAPAVGARVAGRPPAPEGAHVPRGV